jgi:hypothetical protein
LLIDFIGSWSQGRIVAKTPLDQGHERMDVVNLIVLSRRSNSDIAMSSLGLLGSILTASSGNGQRPLRTWIFITPKAKVSTYIACAITTYV